MIQKWLVTMSLSIFLLTGLSTSSFFLADFLTQIIKENKHNANQLNFALAEENEAALGYAWKQSKHGSQYWQELTKKLARSNGEVAYSLANFYLHKDPLDKENIYQSEQAILWYQQAIRLNYSRASIALATLYFHQGNTLAAQSLLAKLPVMALYHDDNVAAIILTTKIAISVGDIELVKSLLNKFSVLLHTGKVGASLLSTIDKYQVLPSRREASTKRSINEVTCANSIQVFATNLLHLTQVERLVERLKNRALNGVVCFSPVRYLPLSALSCSSKDQEAILCDETKFDKVSDSVTTRYMAIMLPKGGANVHFGMLYFDAQDSDDVVEHEISHLLGFVDEYPLVKGHVKCQTSQQQISAQNIAVLQKNYQGERSSVREKVLKQLAWAEQIKDSTPILRLRNSPFNNLPLSNLDIGNEGSQKNQHWQLGTPEQFKQEVGLFRAETCDNNSATQKSTFHAFKPLSGRTKLQYDELSFPTQYIALLHQNSEQFLMPSFHYNIALAYYQQNEIKLAKYWLKQAASWENDESRRNKVLQGAF